MTSREARLASPKLLPGVSARTWSRIVSWSWIASTALFAVGFLFEFIPALKHATSFPGFALIIPAVVVTLILRVTSLTGLPGERAEVRAGYTTLPRKYSNLEQLDPASGAVIREAGRAYLPRWRSRSTLHDPDGGVIPQPSLLRRLVPNIVGWMAAILVSVLVWWLVGIFTARLAAALLIVVPSITLLVAIAALIGSLRMRTVLRRLNDAAPTDFAFVFRMSRGLVPALQALVPVAELPPANLVKSRQATASSSGITFWFGNPPARVGMLPWSKVIAVQQDTVELGRSSFPSVVITFRDDEADEVVALQLMSAEANYLTLPSRSETRWIASKLNQLRTSTTTARLI